MLLMMMALNSVTSVATSGDFLNFLVKKFLIKVAQIFWYFRGYFKCLSESCVTVHNISR